MKRIVAFLMLGLFWACQKPPDEGDYLVMESEPIRKSEILMSEITTNVQIIPLETSEKSLIQKIEKIVKKGGLYYTRRKQAIAGFRCQWEIFEHYFRDWCRSRGICLLEGF